jgi:hypothetical protein
MKSIFILALLFLGGCAAYKSYNQTTTGVVVLRGGVYQNEEWTKALKFTRMSWYHGMTLYFDALIWKADIDSPFSKWFSPQEKEFFTKCETLLVTAGYSADPSRISHVNFREQMKLNGYDDVVINNFSSSLKTHPSANDWRLQNYKIMGYCKRSPSRIPGGKFGINFPSFQQLEIKL